MKTVRSMAVVRVATCKFSRSRSHAFSLTCFRDKFLLNRTSWRRDQRDGEGVGLGGMVFRSREREVTLLRVCAITGPVLYILSYRHVDTL